MTLKDLTLSHIALNQGTLIAFSESTLLQAVEQILKEAEEIFVLTLQEF